MKIKIIRAESHGELEDKVNDFLKSESNANDIKYTTWSASGIACIHFAMIIIGVK